MKKLLTAFLFFNLIFFVASAQNWRMWATYYGGTAQDFANCVTTDASGNVFVAGWTYSPNNISTAGAFQTNDAGSGDAYLVKFNGAGVRIWATYYGGTDGDFGYGIATDAAGNVYLTGYTGSTSGIASAGAYQTTNNGNNDAFLVKFDPNGNRVWGTYFGGPQFDQGVNVATDAGGNVYVTGYTVSDTNIATPVSFQDTIGGLSDAFLAKFSSTGSLIWSTYFGGEDNDIAQDLATGVGGNIFIGGYTTSQTNLASGGFQNTFAGSQDAFLAKFNSAGNRIWSTYYGGPSTELGFGVATDTSGSVYLTGETFSTTGIASPGSYKPVFGGFADAYLVKFDAAGSRLWATYYGGDSAEEGNDVATDAWGNVFIAGDSYSWNYFNNVATPSGFQTSRGGAENEFLAAFTPNGVRTCATYYGKVHEEEGRVCVNPFGDLYLCGSARSTTGISYLGHQNTFGGDLWDGYLVKFSAAVPRPEVIVNNPNLPPTPTVTPIKYYTISLFDFGNIHITNCALRNFTGTTPLPASGSAIIPFTCDFSGMYSNAGPPVAISCTATGSMKVTFVSNDGTTGYYETEMLQLDLSGSTLPAGLMLRESPTLSSPGFTTISNNGGIFRMASFFDVFAELSTDGGTSWHETSGQPSHLELQYDNPTAIPTLGTWGLILLCLLIPGIGLYFIRKG